MDIKRIHEENLKEEIELVLDTIEKLATEHPERVAYRIKVKLNIINFGPDKGLRIYNKATKTKQIVLSDCSTMHLYKVLDALNRAKELKKYKVREWTLSSRTIIIPL